MGQGTSGQQKFSYGTLTYEGKTYKTIAMPDGKVWMAENLNYAANGSKCGIIDTIPMGEYKAPVWTITDKNTVYCDKYGRLYNWETAMKTCPADWHLPSKEEWEALMVAIGGKKWEAAIEALMAAMGVDKWGAMATGAVGDSEALKSKTGWLHPQSGQPYSGEDKYGFAALPGGFGHARKTEVSKGVFVEGMFSSTDTDGEWLTASDFESPYSGAYSFGIRYKGVMLSRLDKGSYMASVRCVQGPAPVPAKQEAVPESVPAQPEAPEAGETP
jgi:uncharacterized protein (TIGR02145 family)